MQCLWRGIVGYLLKSEKILKYNELDNVFSGMPRPLITEMMRWLRQPLEDALGGRYGVFEISFMYQPSAEADGNTVFLLRDQFGQAFAVVLCSAPASPEMVKRGVTRARAAREILEAPLAEHILSPLAEGRANELSYAVLPYCQRLSDNRAIWWAQRSLLSTPLFGWLRRLT